jgi:hypothetical protein
MRHQFVPSYYKRKIKRIVQEQSIVVSLATPNLSQDSDPKHEVKDDLVAPGEDTSSYAISEPSLPNDPPTPTTNTGTAHDATLMDGENCLNVLYFSTNHDIIEQLSVEPSLDESLSHAVLLDVPCDTVDLVDNASVLHALEPNTIAETKHVMHIVSANDEQKLLSSLHTLGYIEFEVLCNLDCLEEQLSKYADLSCFSKHTYHAIGKYNNKGEYIIHRVYICENLNYPFVVLNFNPLEGSHTTHIHSPFSSLVSVKQVYFQEGEHCWLLHMPTLSFVGTKGVFGRAPHSSRSKKPTPLQNLSAKHNQLQQLHRGSAPKKRWSWPQLHGFHGVAEEVLLQIRISWSWGKLPTTATS